MGSRGKALSEDQIRRIVSLLASTELTVPEIAERMGCSRSTIVTVNRFHGVRDYQGQRNAWVCGTPARALEPETERVAGREGRVSRR